mmetsp:Transcript_22626/g.40871  ORF Transcript_22626/g.40871 Transcript_22626/m.40871 type:complete len:235 (+) Transcript_22626:52-756(+)|eukprot:CAMPEP_0197663532 /NCGR_PEP_ID=MMETSP1338-20131121/57762_1 /TAXON_ID=43686 ORGANISM="Pelagodinium beii, Strain RCC1491" /NCGR_SAMPLE_ID=MMETSP1338 /ASSEMBLY_ACC=CAM_ASM_000754 /LENGTH=234 /DNA_ID=CAMNT_0043241953 /DNA_START=52 /DNA_END=756 /DNA_ORIENTATION=-
MAAAATGARHGREIAKKMAVEKRIRKQAEHDAIANRTAALTEKIMRAFDGNFSGTIEREEMKPMLHTYAVELLDAGSGDVVPSDDDIEFLLLLCNRTDSGEALARENVLNACYAWGDFIEQKSMISNLIKSHDADSNGAIDKGEMASMFEELDPDLKEIPPEVIDWIFTTADISKTGMLTHMETARAISAFHMWKEDYTPDAPAKYVFLSRDIAKEDVQELPQPVKKSSTCTLL